MTHYTYRGGDTVEVYSTSVDGVVFKGDIKDWAEWKIERAQPTVFADGQEVGGGPYENADPEEVIDDYESNEWFFEKDL